MVLCFFFLRMFLFCNLFFLRMFFFFAMGFVLFFFFCFFVFCKRFWFFFFAGGLGVFVSRFFFKVFCVCLRLGSCVCFFFIRKGFCVFFWEEEGFFVKGFFLYLVFISNSVFSCQRVEWSPQRFPGSA